MGIKCRNNCDIEIHFDPNVRSNSGKPIPLEYDGRPHNCPMNPYRKRTKSHTLNGISFDEENGFLNFGNFIMRKSDFCKCGIYKGLLSTNGGGMVIVKNKY